VDEQDGRSFQALTAGVARSVALGRLFEVFLVAAVASLLLIRGGLALTGFPKVGGGGLHIAHMLWGGLLMLGSLLLLLGFIGRRALSIGAFVSGVGFGTFIDEIGKFITSDNDYFFRPAVSVVYVVFVALFLISRALESRRRYSERELQANAFDAAREAHLTGRMPSHSAPVLAYLRAHAGDDPVLVSIRDALERTPYRPPPLPRPLRLVQRAVLRQYLSLVDSDGLGRVIAGVFAGYTAFILLTMGVAVAAYLSSAPPSPLGKGGIAFTGLLASNAASLLLIVVAATSLRVSRLAALTWFYRAVMVDLLLGQVFAFYLLQFGALLGVGLDLIALLILSGAIRTERNLLQHSHTVSG
jgi:hypothetical protein